MHKVIESVLVSADGVIGEPHTWTGEHFGDDAIARSIAQLEHTDVMLMGRNTYETFKGFWGEPSDPYAAAIYNVKKYVFSSTLTDTDWNNTEIVASPVAQFVRGLKAHGDGDGDILIYGHGPVGQELLEHDLVDELKLWVHPVVIGGSGVTLFRGGLTTPLTLLNSEVTPTGVVVSTYRPGKTRR